MWGTHTHSTHPHMYVCTHVRMYVRTYAHTHAQIIQIICGGYTFSVFICTCTPLYAPRHKLHTEDTFIVSYPLLQKLENLSLIDEAWLISGTLPANTHKNRSKDVLPCECACHLHTPPPPHPFLSAPVLGLHVRVQYTFGVVSCLFLHTFPIVTSNLIHSPTSPFFLR